MTENHQHDGKAAVARPTYSEISYSVLLITTVTRFMGRDLTRFMIPGYTGNTKYDGQHDGEISVGI